MPREGDESGGSEEGLLTASETHGDSLDSELVSPLLAQVLAGSTGRAELDAAEILEELRGLSGADLPRFAGGKRTILAALDVEVARIDALLSDQVNAILHAPEFQQLEAGWRGLKYLTDSASGIDGAKVRFLALSWNELVRDLERAADFDQSQLFNKVYSEEFGMPGGEPFGLIVADYAVQHLRSQDHPTDDVTALKNLAAVGAAAFTPIVLGVAPSVFQLDSFRELGRPIDVRSIFRSTEYQRWNAMREGPDMNFIGLTMPRILMRLPYGDDNTRTDSFRFTEAVHAKNGKSYLWGNAAFAFAGVVLRAFGDSGWFADIRGAPRDEIRAGLVTDIPVPYFRTDKPWIAVKPSTECLISDTHEKDLTEFGFTVLRKVPLTNYSVFNECQSIKLPARYDGAMAAANARMSAMLQYTLCVSRFAHFIKVMGREKVGSVVTAEECESFLQRWLTNYCEASDGSSMEIKARYPLREGIVEVKNVPGKPGSYSCNIFLRPHFQLDDITAGFKLVTELAPASRP